MWSRGLSAGLYEKKGECEYIILRDLNKSLTTCLSNSLPFAINCLTVVQAQTENKSMVTFVRKMRTSLFEDEQ